MGTASRIEIEEFIDRMVGEKVEVNDRVLMSYRDKGEFGALSFGLLKEATGLMGAVGGYLSGIRGRYQLTRDEAVCAGLVVRMFKLMMSIVKLSTGVEHGETVRVLSRCVLESSIDLRYLLQEDTEELFDQFVMVGLRGERLLYEAIKAKIQGREGGMLAIEARMLASIEATCANSGVSIEQVRSNAGNWGGGYRSRMQALGVTDEAYSGYAIESQSVHGSWANLVVDHLDSDGFGFEVDMGHRSADGGYLGPVALCTLESARAYVDRCFEVEDGELFQERLVDLIERLQRVDGARPGWERVSGT